MIPYRIDIADLLAECAKVRLSRLAKALGVSPDVLIALLEDSGYIIPGRKHHFLLSEDHLEVISKWYVKSIEKLFENSSKRIHTLTRRRKKRLFEFFSRFIIGSENYTEESIYFGRISRSRIESFFSHLVQVAINGLDSYVKQNKNSYQVRLKIQLSRTYLDIQQKIIAIFIEYYYSSLKIDEDSERGNHYCFS
jgi:hypothetical protein